MQIRVPYMMWGLRRRKSEFGGMIANEKFSSHAGGIVRCFGLSGLISAVEFPRDFSEVDARAAG